MGGVGSKCEGEVCVGSKMPGGWIELSGDEGIFHS